MDTRNNPHRRLKTQSRQSYLITYNAISCLLWISVLGRVLLLVPLVGTEEVYNGTGEWTKWVQTLMVLEVGHAATHLVRAPISTTALQVLSRILLVWPICHLHPSLTPSPFYSTMLLAWSVTEIIRYAYFTFSLTSEVPGWLKWLRYNTFYVLYPLGITSEFVLVAKAWVLYPWGTLGNLLLTGALAAYVPGSWIMYTHMMGQRRRVMRGKGKAKD